MFERTRFYIKTVFYCFLFNVVLFRGGLAYQRCLINSPEINPKIYPHFDDKPVSIVLETSSRITHQLNTHVFRIFAEEVLGYQRLEIKNYEDNFQTYDSIHRLTDYSEIQNIPVSMINLEVWMPTSYESVDWESNVLVKECGSVAAPGGRFGWYIPIEFQPILQSFYKNWYKHIKEVHWPFLREPANTAYFDIEGEPLKMIQKYSIKNATTNEYFCERNCTNGQYIPEQCKYSKCALLLTANYEATEFVIQHINELKLYVKVIWLGENLSKALTELREKYKATGVFKGIMILYWTPSLLNPDNKDFISVQFQNCELMKSSQVVGCKYDMNRLVKYSWSKLESFAKPLYDSLRLYTFNNNQYEVLLEMYINSTHKDIETIACEWMREHELEAKTQWTGSVDSILYIGGIFPVTNSIYAGAGIARAANLAIKAINANKTILPNYNLSILSTDGECKADIVMRRFIDYIIDQYSNLVGVLGPACSDTVEPLAGVSKHFRTMVISYSAEGATFSDRTKYPYFFRTIGENRNYRYVYLKLFQYFQWKQVAALTEDGQKYTEYISQMQGLLQENKINFIANTKFSRDAGQIVMTRYLENLKKKRARIIIADVVAEVARSMMCEAYKLKMTAREGYVWFLPILNSTWYHTDRHNDILKENVNCTTQQMAEAINGYFSMAHAYYAADDQVMQENITVKEWRRNYENESVKYHHNISDYAGYAYDAVWTYAFAIDKLAKTDPEALSDIHSVATIQKFVKIIENTDFNGVSGRIKFRGGPSRFSIINIIQWYNYDAHIIGQFYPNLTDDSPEILGGKLNINRSLIRWFTPNNEKPGDGLLPPEGCALGAFAEFLNVDCSVAIIILNVIVVTSFVILVGVVVYKMKKRYDHYMKTLGLDIFANGGGLADLDKFEIPREAVVINRKLGEGAFGSVYGGEANFNERGWLPVAVKTLKIGSTKEEKLDFLSEAEIMKRFNHPNVMKLMAVCLKKEPLYTIMEFMLYGDLKTYLLARRHLANSKNDGYDEVSVKRLNSMALDVAKGLAYLAEMKYVHRDLASRNCLVSASRNVKIGDFGMTRPMSENDYYRFNRKGMLPVRWMAPESLGLGLFTPASDIWSYGVLLYEIITFGSFPFQGMSNGQVLDYIKEGHTLAVPQGVKPPLETLLKSCWDRTVKNRPMAKQIVNYLSENPTLIQPCLDVPIASLQLDTSDDLEMQLPEQFRKCSTPTSKNAPMLSNGLPAISLDHTVVQRRQKASPEKAVSIPMESYCPKEPLLGSPQRSSVNLINLGKYISPQHNKHDSGIQYEDEGYVPPSALIDHQTNSKV